MRFSRKIVPEIKPRQNFITKKKLREDEIDFDKLRSYRLDRVRKELVKNNLEACILFDPVNVRYALDTVNMSVYNMHNLTRYCFVPVNGPTILYEYFNCEILSKHLNLIDEIRPAITWDYFSNGDQADNQLLKYNAGEAKVPLEFRFKNGVLTLFVPTKVILPLSSVIFPCPIVNAGSAG